MADNVAITPGSGATIATDDVGGVQYQRVKLDLGGDGVSSPLLRGQQAKANSLPVALASDQDAVPVSDGGGVLTVDGTVTVLDGGGSLTVDNAALESLVLAEDAAHVTGDKGVMALGVRNDAGSVLAADGDYMPLSLNGSGALRVVTIASNTAVGAAAHDAAISGNPVRIGARASSADYAAVSSGDTADLICDPNGKQIVMPYALPQNFVAGVTAAITGTSDTAVIAAGAVGIRNYVTSLTVTNAHASVGTVVELKDGSTVIHRGYAAPNGGGYTVQFPVPLRGAAATAINAANITTGANTYVSASGFQAP